MNANYSIVADDIEWLRDEWWHPGNEPSEGHIRRGSAAIDLLLRQGMLGRAWRHFGFPGGEPTLEGPDVQAFLDERQQQPDMTIALVAGGGRVGRLQIACLGAARADNPEMGVSANASEGFAVFVGGILREAGPPTAGDLDHLVHREWKISEFLRSTGAIRNGKIITRGEVIDYFRNYAGGAHADFLRTTRTAKTDQHELVNEMLGRLIADEREGLHFELLSIGQAIGRSNSIEMLRQAIRASESHHSEDLSQ